MPKAKKDLYIGFVKARNKGDEVSLDDAKRNGWEKDLETDTSSTKKTETETPKDK